MAASGSLINWSSQDLQKLPATLSCDTDAHTLILDKNQLIKLEHLENWKNLMQLSVANNRLVRMMGVAKLTQLRVLNLPHNSISYIEGLKDLVHLEWLNLAGNNLKTIDQINCCTSLQHLDLSDNNISQLGDISKLLSLKTLLLHGNIITSLRTAPACLPRSLAIFSLAENEIRDLNEISFLASLPDLEQLSIMNNPCVMATPSVPGFDYRPYIVSWCLGLKVLDGYVISQKESLKAEWLYSQGKGRSFRPGQHIQLVHYLAGVCPLTTMFGLQTAEDAKLEKILHKQRLHQRQLMCQSQADEPPVSLMLNKRASANSGPNSPVHGPQITAESEPTIKKNTWVATKSNDDHSYALKNVSTSSVQLEEIISKDLYLDDIQTDEDKLNSSLLSSESTFMPVAPGLSPMSPTAADLKLHGICMDTEEMRKTNLEFIKQINSQDKEKKEKTPVVVGDGTFKTAESVETQEEEEGTASISTLSAVTNHTSCPIFSEDLMKCNDHKQSLIPEERLMKTVSVNRSLEEVPSEKPVVLIQKEERFEKMSKAATKLQACWRGYYTRNHHPKAKEVRYEIRLSRMQEHIVHLAEEVKKLRKEKDEEKLQRLVQEEAIKFLWDQVKHIQKWQLSVNPYLSSIWQRDIPPSNILGLSEVPMESSGLNQAPSPVDSSTWLTASAEICHQKYLPQFPDSGFHSCVTDQNCLNDSQASEENAEATYGDSSVENSLETIKQREDNLSRCPSETEEVQLGLGECSKESFSSEHENSLLQQYLKSVEQLDNADDKSICSSRTEINSPNTAVLSEEPYGLCSAVSSSEEMFSSVHNGMDHTAEICNLNAEIAEEKQIDTESSLQVLPVSITV